MKTKERIRPALKVIRIIVGCIIALLAGACAFCAFVVLFSALKPNAPGEQSGFFLLCFVLFAILFYAMVWGRGIKNGSAGKNQAKPVVQRVPKSDCPQPSEDQKRLEEIERNLDYAVGAIMANPMTPGKAAYDAEIAALQQEKQTRLRRMAKHMENVTVQDAWNTFTPEQQKRFDAQIYQYSQDVGRDGVLPREVYAENRGLVFVDGRPVPKEVAARFEELQKAAAVKEPSEFGYSKMVQKALEQGELNLCILGFGEYHLPPRNERYDRLTDYDLLLRQFDRYQQRHPGKPLQETYEKVLEEMICSGKPSYIYCAAVCTLAHIELEQTPYFHFRLRDKEKILRLAASSMEEHHKAIVEFLDALFDGQVNAEAYYTAVLRDCTGSECKMAKTKYDRPTKEEPEKVKTWVNLIGKPGQHGDVIRIGFGDGKCFLEITNDGFPHGGGAGGMMVTVPSDVIVGSRLDARKFLEFYRSVYPGGTPIDDFTDRIWIYEPTPGRPKGNIEIIQHLSTKENKQNGTFDFEKKLEKREVVKAEDAYYIRVTEYQCSAEANGRPVYFYTESYHVCYLAEEKIRLKPLTADSALRFSAKSAAYQYKECGTGVLF